MVSRSKPVATDPEEVVDDAVHGCKALQMGRRLEAAHLPLAGGSVDETLRLDCSHTELCSGRPTASRRGTRPRSCAAYQ